jgi:hypothetical protein
MKNRIFLTHNKINFYRYGLPGSLEMIKEGFKGRKKIQEKHQNDSPVPSTMPEPLVSYTNMIWIGLILLLVNIGLLLWGVIMLSKWWKQTPKWCGPVVLVFLVLGMVGIFPIAGCIIGIILLYAVYFNSGKKDSVN